VFDPEPLSDEMHRSFVEGLLAPADPIIGSGGVEFRTVPMMCARTPASVSLLDALAGPAAELLGREVLPLRAKGTRYGGSSGWHSDSELDVPSIGFVAYLESLGAENGALRVRPGSHHMRATDAFAADPVADGEALETEPGDVIAFDEHLVHGSTGGAARRQWRVDFVIDPLDAREESQVREYFGRIYEVGWDGGYDVDRYPSYGSAWRNASRPWTRRLAQLGVYDLADVQEDHMRSRRRTG
jgi:hypothetical protein